MTPYPSCRLSDCCVIKPPKSEARKLLKPDELVSFVQMENLGINSKALTLEKTRKLADVSGSYTYFADNDVLLAKITPCFENGKLGIANGLKNGVGFGSSEFIVFRPKDNLTPEYLYYFLVQPSFRTLGQSVMTGAVGHRRVPKEFIENTEIPLPSIPEQQRIVAILDQAFSDIEKARANAEQNLKNARELFDSYLQQVFSQRAEGWASSELGLLGQITSSKRIFKHEYVESGIPFFRTKEVKQLANGQAISTELFITEEKYELIKRKHDIPKVGDVLITAIGTIGEIYVIDNDDPFYFKDGNVLWLKQFGTLNSNFLKYALMAFVSELNRLSRGAAYNALPIQKLKCYVISYPQLSVQDAVVSDINTLKVKSNKLADLYQRKLIALDELKKSILKKAFSGELTNSKGLAA